MPPNYEHRRLLRGVRRLHARYRRPPTFNELWVARSTYPHAPPTDRESVALDVARLIRDGKLEVNGQRQLTLTNDGQTAIRERAAEPVW